MGEEAEGPSPWATLLLYHQCTDVCHCGVRFISDFCCCYNNNNRRLLLDCYYTDHVAPAPAVLFWGGAPPPGGEAPSNFDLVMSVCLCIHPKP